MPKKLKPCPFCGGTDLDIRQFDMGISCRGCGAWMPSVVSSDKAASHTASDAWNRRAPDPRIEKAREALRTARELSMDGATGAALLYIETALAALSPQGVCETLEVE